MNDMKKPSREDIIIMLMVILIAMTCSFGIDIHLPSIPSIINYFHSTVGTGQLSVSLYVMSMTASLLIYGPISDRLGRKPVIIFGLVIAMIGSVVCVLASSIWVFLLGRTTQGIGAAVGLGLGRSVLNDVFNQTMMVRYGSYVSITLALGLMIGPMLGGYMQAWLGWRGTFGLMGVLFLIDILIVASFLKETAAVCDNDDQPVLKIVKDYSYLLRQRIFLIYSFCTGIGLGLTLVYSSMSSFIFQGIYNQSAVAYGWIGAIIGSGSLFGKILSGQISSKLGVRAGAAVGFSCYLVVGVVIACFQSVFGLRMFAFIGLVLIGTMGQGFISVNTIAGAFPPYRSMGGTASALYGSLLSLVGFIVSLIISLGGFHSNISLAISYCLLSLMGLFLLSGLS